jgi:hypothetical protein
MVDGALPAIDVAMLAAVLLGHGYVWLRMVRDPTVPGRGRRSLTVLVVALACLVVFTFVVPYPPAALVPLQWVGFVWLGVFLYAVLVLVVLEPVRVGLRWWLRRAAGHARVAASPAAIVAPAGAITVSTVALASEAATPPETRRLFLARGLAAAAGTVALAVAGSGVGEADEPPVVRSLPVTLAGLDPALDGFRLVAFSDVHVSSRYRGRRLEQLVEVVNAHHPDAVAIIGDLVDGRLRRVREELAPIAGLESAQGVFFVTGNHEYAVDTEHVLEHLATLGVRTLRNERVTIGRGRAGFDLAGVDGVPAAESELAGHGTDLATALGSRDESRPVVLLAHEPAVIDEAAAAGVDLQLSGHTHGGQLWPFDYAVRLGQPIAEGYSRHGRTQLFVTSGVGFWGPPMRVGARPEVVVVELRAP